MSSLKITYGIDLGTTNSAITHFENGTAVVKKNSLQGDTTPSCVAFNKSGKVLVGARAHAQLGKDYSLRYRKPGYEPNTFIEFKRQMGTDQTWYSSNLRRNLTPEELSAEVLKELRRNILDENVTSAVITVPAMFNNTQKDATKRAASLAGFEHVELIQEPVAASVAYGLSSKMKNAYWVVFDFGGGTFDAALMRIQDGVMQAIDTAGNNKLGGKDIDKAILEEIIIPYLRQNFTIDNILSTRYMDFLNMWKAKAEEAKIQLSFEEEVEIETDLGDDFGTDDLGEELSLALTVTRDDLERVAVPIYQRAVDITSQLLERNNLRGSDLGALILVGGPTHSPIIRRMLREQVTPNVDTSIDPMTCVAAGAAIYGSTIDVPEEVADAHRDPSKIQLGVSFQSTSVETEEWVAVTLLRDKCANFSGSSVRVEFARNDGMFSTPQGTIDENGDVVQLSLVRDSTNVFDIRCFDERGNRLECEPSQITIIQGIAGLGDAVLPMAIGIGLLDDANQELFVSIDGLEKSRKLPTRGFIANLKTPKEIRAGVETDEVRMSLYQSDEVDDRMRVLYCQRIYDVFLNGDDISRNLPEGSIINIALNAERSGTINRFEVEIPALNLNIDLTERMVQSTTSAPSPKFMFSEFESARRRARELNNSVLDQRLANAERQYNQGKNDRDIADGILSELQSICRELDREYNTGEWNRMENRVRGMFSELEEDNRKYGNAESSRLLEHFRTQMPQILSRRDVKLAKDFYDQMRALDFRIARVDFYIVWISEWNREFDNKSWSDPARARELVNRGMDMIQRGTNADALQPVVDEIMNLLPYYQKPDTLHS